MAEIHTKKSIIQKRGMAEFKQKGKTGLAKVKSGLVSFAKTVHAGATSPTAKKVGSGVVGFLRNWGESTKARYEAENKPTRKSKPRKTKKKKR